MNTTEQTAPSNPKFQALVAKLREIFQIDKPELDFGIYRILHVRSAAINDFLDHRLAEKVRAALASNKDATKAMQKDAIEKMRQSLQEAGVKPEESPKLKELEEQYKVACASEDASETQVYAHLLTFFGRYYDNGDFISKRRYKDGVYALPYSGEEVKLVWANQDQYYTKSGENFTNYDFKLSDGKRVHFKLVAADTAKDNVKDNDAVRCFVLWDPKNAPAPQDGEGDEDGQPAADYPADFIEEKGDELFIYFQYLKCPKGTKQTALVTAATTAIIAALEKNVDLLQKFNLLAKAPTEKDKDRTVLGRELDRYVAKNTSDYFIHKDLKGFLTREMDFYIKNEMMNLDDIQNAATFDALGANLRPIQTFRLIATELIAFMAQLEEFQKKIWLKKKFVVSCEYCFTLDRVPKPLLPEIFANKAQQAEWERLGLDWKAAQKDGCHPAAAQGTFALGDKEDGKPAALNNALMVDTKFFDADFKARLLKGFTNLDDACDGLLIHSENFQALNLLQERYKGQVKCIYIDPPYNTGSDGFIYRDNYQHSSWLSMMENRLGETKPLIGEIGVLFISIDDEEQENLKKLCSDAFGFDSFVAEAVRKRRDSQANLSKNISPIHEYVEMYSMKRGEILFKVPASICETDYTNPDKDPRGPYKTMPCTNKGGTVYTVTSPTGMKITDEWRFKKATYDQLQRDNRLVFPRGGNGKPRYKLFLSEKKANGVLANTWWDELPSNQEATRELSAMFGWAGFSMPKPTGLIQFCARLSADATSTVLDYFAGSGTTGHAVINLNREDGGKRKYILVEMGDHFDTVLKPRIEKVVYSPEWKDGKPLTGAKGISHGFKYLTLESYEDALNNLELNASEAAGTLPLGMKDAYLLRYMLDIESRGSLLSTADFRHPFDYTLKIAVDSSGASAPRKVDLVETFNYLIGLRVDQIIDRVKEEGVVLVEGRLEETGGKPVLVVWRDCDRVDAAALNALLANHGVWPGETEFAAVYVNGDHAIPNVTLAKAGETEDGQKTLKVRQIENEFLPRMFGA